jgi:hypothetical protein
VTLTRPRAVERRDDRLRRLGSARDTSPPPSPELFTSVEPRLVVECPPPPVRRARKRAARAGDDDGAHGVVGVGLVERLDRVVHHPDGERVQLVRTMERDGGDAVGHLEQNLLKRHRVPRQAADFLIS